MKRTRHHRHPLRRGMTLIELTVVILVLLALVSVLFIGGRAWKKGADRSGCIMNLRNVQQAVRSHQNLNDLNVGATIDIASDLIGADNYLQTTPVCPGAGSYTLGSEIPDIGTLVMECSLSTSDGHVPGSIAGW